jgi:hypothetical protein
VSNPYESPSGIKAPPKKLGPLPISRVGMNISEALNFAFGHPNWMVNCILIGVVNLIPILGPIVTLGYLYDDYTAHLQHGTPSPSEFKIEKFMDYLQRGIGAFLAVLLVSLATGFLAILCVAPFLISGLLVMKESNELGVTLFIMGECFGILVNIILGMLTAPIVLRVGISNKFEEISNIKWAIAMTRMVWPQMILGAIAAALVGFVAGPVGVLMCCVGIIPVIGFISYFHFHLQRQWYEIYVTKGGEPIPLPVESLAK